jgi:hypothetical protein
MMCWARRLPAAVIVSKRKVSRQIHSIVQDAHDLDRPFRDNPIHQKMAAAKTVPRNMQRTEAGHDLVSRSRPRSIGTIGKFTDSLSECVPISSGLPQSEVLGGPPYDICEIELCRGAEANAPLAFGHETTIRRFWK